MTAEIFSNGDMQFEKNFSSPRFEDSLDQNDIDPHDIDFSFMLGEQQKQPPLQLPPLEEVHVKPETDNIGNEEFFEANNGNADDMFNVDMFDFGLNETDSFPVFDNDGEQNSVLLSPSNLCMDDNITPSTEDNACPFSASSALVPIDSDSLEMQLPPMPLARNNIDSDGFTDLEDQLYVQHPSMDNPFPTVPMEQNPFYNDIQINWPPLNEMQCGSCQIFRRIVHSNGIQDTKLEIHGRNGQFYHAVMHTRCSITGVPSNLEPQTVEFAMANTEYVKQFLFQYSLLRRREGFAIRYDSLSPYPEPIGMDMYFNPNTVSGFYNQPFQQQPYLNPFELASGLHAPNNGFIPGQPLAGQFYMDRNFYAPYGVDQRGMIPNTPPAKPPKSNVAAQRERTGKLKISDLAAYFHLPINVAAKELAICPTVLKKICRRNGMRRWPHRKIKSIERIIMTLEQTIAEGNGEGVESIQSEIAMLKNERAQLCAGFVGEK